MIFISYRRDDGDWPVVWLAEQLVAHFGDGEVFQDRRSILPGDDFAAVLVASAKGCSALIAVMGPRWEGPLPDGRRRIDDADDWVRVEIETAISRGVRVIPVLVHGARMPSAEDLPETLRSLAGKQAVTLDPSSLDIGGLITALEKDT
jgi:TIR domain